MTRTTTTRTTFFAALAALTLGGLGLASLATADPAPGHATPEMMAHHPQLF